MRVFKLDDVSDCRVRGRARPAASSTPRSASRSRARRCTSSTSSSASGSHDAADQGRRRARVPRGLHVQGRARSGSRGASTTRSRCSSPSIDAAQHHAGDRRRRGRGRRSARCASYPDRFFAGISIDPNEGMEAVRKIDRYANEFDLQGGRRVPGRAVPAGRDQRQEVLSDLREVRRARRPVLLDRRRARAAPPVTRRRTSRYIDEVCWFFPELKFVTRHGCEPWTDLAVKLLLKWPNLYYSTTAFAPKYYPKDIIDFANTRGADKVIFSGYFPAGLTYDRIFDELPDVPFRDHVWPKFLRENAQRVFKLPRRRDRVTATQRSRRPARGRRHRHDDRVARRRARSRRSTTTSSASRRTTPRARTWEFPAQYMFKGVPHYDQVDDPVDMLVSPRWTSTASRKALTGIARPKAAPSARCERVPRPVLRRRVNVDPNEGMDAVRKLDAAVQRARRQGGALLGHRAHPAGAAQRQEDVPDLREVRRARHPDLRVRRRARAAHPLRAAGRRPARRGVLVLPRAEDRHAPRRRAVDRARW